MSERYGACRSCLGRKEDCYLCDGTGLSGDVMDYLDPKHALRISFTRDNEISFKEVLHHAVQAFLSRGHSSS